MEVLVGKHFGANSYGPNFNQQKKKYRWDVEIFRKDTREVVSTFLHHGRTQYMTPNELKELVKDEVDAQDLEKIYFRQIIKKKSR